MLYGMLYSSIDLATPSTLIKKSLGTYAGQSLKITNNTQYELDIFLAETQIDVIPPYKYLIMQNMSGLYFSLNLFEQSSIILRGQYASFTVIDGQALYQMGDTAQISQTQSSYFYTTWQGYSSLNWNTFANGYKTFQNAIGA